MIIYYLVKYESNRSVGQVSPPRYQFACRRRRCGGRLDFAQNAAEARRRGQFFPSWLNETYQREEKGTARGKQGRRFGKVRDELKLCWRIANGTF